MICVSDKFCGNENNTYLIWENEHLFTFFKCKFKNKTKLSNKTGIRFMSFFRLLFLAHTVIPECAYLVSVTPGVPVCAYLMAATSKIVWVDKPLWKCFEMVTIKMVCSQLKF